MIGQDFVVATLQKSIAAGKIAHAYLFSGPRGCGKTSSARILAKALNCEKGPGGTPCGVCTACTEITRGSSLDVIEIDGASNTSVNDVRQIKDEVQFPPNSLRYKVYIIDEVHMLSSSAFNALLKTIEEPPPYVIFIFATTELHKVPATIKSRCQQFNFRLVAVDQLKAVLADAASESGIMADDEALFWVAREATGSVRDAYTLFDQVAAFSDGHITFEKIRDKLGLVGVDRINPVVEACAERDAQTALSSLDDILQNGVSVEQFTVDMADYFRSLLLIRSGIRKESLLGQSPDRFSEKVLKTWTPVQIERALSIMLQLFRDIRYSLDPRYELELAVSRLSWISDYVSPAEMKTAISRAQNLLQGGSSPGGSVSARSSGGPFDEADRPAPPVQTVRPEIADGAAVPVGPTATPASIRPVASAGMTGEYDEGDDGEERIADPFAAFKQRLNGGRFGASPASAPVARQEPAAEPTITETSAAEALPSEGEEPATPPVPPVSAEASSPEGAIPFAELQDSLVASFESTKNMVATGLRQSFDWSESGGSVRFSVQIPFMHNFLAQEQKSIAEAASRMLRRPVGIEILLDTSKAASGDSAEKIIPPQVELVRQMFKGTITGEG
jgi:DNA polymerase-3 subunit gamma/tau